jgi:outer membrane protein OmpA-like peptidoglycan-associated protein
MRRIKLDRSATFDMSARWALPVLAGTGLLASFLWPREAHAEGSVQLGQIDDGYSGGLRSATVLSVDVGETDQFLNIVARGAGGGDVAVTITAPDGTVIPETLTVGEGRLTSDTVPATLPSMGAEPLRIAVGAGRYTVEFADDVEPFDITLTETDTATYNPADVPSGGGRLSSKDWRFFGDLPGAGEVDMNANFYVRAPVGDALEYVWELDFEGLLGGQMCLTANSLGLPGEFARSSQPFIALDGVNGFDGNAADTDEQAKFALCDDLSQFDIYLNVPSNRQPEPDAPAIEAVGIGSCGAIIEGTGGAISFDASLEGSSNLEGTYVVVVDVDKDDVFDPKTGDVALGGNAEEGTNLVLWDGLDANGDPVPAGESYAARVFLRLGEFHFTGTDIEAIDPGIAVRRVLFDGSTEPARISWDDEAVSANNFNNAAVEPSAVWTTPDGAAAGLRHAWRGESAGGTQYDGPGENAFIDSWVFGAESVGTVTFDMLESNSDLDGDGLINGRECEIGSLVNDVDSDQDGVGDHDEEPSNALGDESADLDEDGLPDAVDDDDDGDGVPTALEEPSPDGGGRDSDNDGAPDYLDDDDDGDGVPTALENPDPNSNGEVDDAQNSDEDDIPDYLDDDDDDDGIKTESEGPSDTGPDDAQDTDDDDVPDYLDGDDDDDGVPTAEEGADDNDNGEPEDAVNTDGSGPPDYLDDDDDGDGIPTDEELTDDDNNGTPDYLEPPVSDSDGDGVPNEEECPGADDCVDTDEDDEPNFQDPDDDNDGVLTRDEDVDGDGDPSNDDSDNDAIPDYLDEDDDGDGVATQFELTDSAADAGAEQRDSDADGTPDYLDRDDDDDGIFTLEEGSNPDEDGDPSDSLNTDGDDLPNYLDADDDDDGIATEDEDPDPNEDGVPSDARDSDSDGTPDYLQAGGPADAGTGNGSNGDSGVNAPKDTDGDGLYDDAECPNAVNCVDSDADGKPNFDDPDDDNDGILTSEENADPNADGDPTDARDADGDQVPDYLDNDGDPDMDGIPTTQEGADPNGDGDLDDARDSDGDGAPDYIDADDDGDGVLTSWERPDANGDGDPSDGRDSNGDGSPDYLDPDDDGDGVLTRLELPDRNADGNPVDALDTDKDGTPDYLDRDDDGDGKSTQNELGNPDNPRDTDKDGDPDYLDKTDNRALDDDVLDAASIEGGGFGCAVARPGATSQAELFGWFAAAFGVALWTRRRRRVSALAAASLLTSGIASAQTEVSPGFSLNRYNPSERGSDWFASESLDLRGSGRVAVGIVGDWAYKPLVSYDESGEEIAPVIENQVYAHAGLSINLWERLRLAASFPVLLYQSGTPVDFNGMRYQTTEGVQTGDVRLGADLRLFGEYGDAATMAVGIQFHLPTGNQAAYTSDDRVRFMPRAALAGDAGILAYALHVGLDARMLRYDYAEQAFGTDLRFGGSLGLRLADKKLLLGPEIWGATVLSDDGDGLFEQQTTPLEGVLGGHYFAGDWRFGLGVGPGFTKGFGSPALRVLGMIEWFPQIETPPPAPTEPEDTDGDGILDRDDACPVVAGVANADPGKHGCPPERKDTDKDGIYDDEDACVDDAGVANDDAKKHGCPPDTDGDTIIDRDDACVDVPGEPNEDRSKNGCPKPKDTDGDGIVDPEDVCPDRAGPASDDPAKHGCPRAQVEGERVIILDRIEFDTGKATIRLESEPILDAVRAVLDENPQIKKLRVEGHTDNKGGRVMNLGLSRRRAAAVVQWLVEHGIGAERLTSQGVGPDRPVDDNNTDEGRQNNRRVEFHIVDAQ